MARTSRSASSRSLPLPPTLDSLGLAGPSLRALQGGHRPARRRHPHLRPDRLRQVHDALHDDRVDQVAGEQDLHGGGPDRAQDGGGDPERGQPGYGLRLRRRAALDPAQDPDSIMVGEIRDEETARIAAEAAMTGHLVFSTLHTLDAASAVHRLVEMGLPPYFVAAAFTCIVSQRLVRCLCPHCRKPRTVRATTWEGLGLGKAPRRQMRIYDAVGCLSLLRYRVPGANGHLRGAGPGRGDGRHDRRGESRCASSARRHRASGVESARDDGVRKVLAGETSLSELTRVVI